MDTDQPTQPPSGRAVAAAMHTEELGRAGSIGLFYALIGVITGVWAPTLQGHPDLKGPIAVVLLCFAVASLLTWSAARNGRYSKRLFRAYGVMAVITSTTMLVYLGPFSPTALAVTLGIAFFGQSADRVGAAAICGSAILLYALILLGLMTGLTEDIGVYRGDEAGNAGRWFMTVMVPLVLVVTLSQARSARAATERALGEVLALAAQERQIAVQLEEAQAELSRWADRSRGRLTGQNLGAYRLGRLLGSGGVGEVYEAVDGRDVTRVALKVLNLRSEHDEMAIARFVREGTILARLKSPYVARVHEHGKLQDGTLFIAMEFLEGEDLAAILRAQGRLTEDETAEMARQVCSALREAHEAGVVHRDVKPHNLFRTQDGTWKVLDFGVSKMMEGGTQLTQGWALGTPQYMAPEQARAEEITTQTDIYGLGATLYRALTGQPPNPSRGQAALVFAAMRRPARPRSVFPELNPHLEDVLALALAPDRELRFQTVEELDRCFTQAMTEQLAMSYRERAMLVPWGGVHVGSS